MHIAFMKEGSISYLFFIGVIIGLVLSIIWLHGLSGLRENIEAIVYEREGIWERGQQQKADHENK